MKYFLQASPEDAALRLDVFLSSEIEDLTRSRIRNLIQEGAVMVDGATVTKAGFFLKGGESVQIDSGEPQVLEARPENLPIDILYQDNDIAVINKARGMVTHPAPGSPNGTLVNAALYHIKDLSSINGVIRPGIVHRLDKDTSGLIVIAKNDAAHNSLAKQIAEKSAKRYYWAILDGNIKEDCGIVEQPIDRSPKDRKKMAVMEGGRHAKTAYKVLERFGSHTLAEFELFTGRTHQIRVHAAYIHHPVTGDTLYGGCDKFDSHGQLLHAVRLELTHPSTGDRLVFEAEPPEIFRKALEFLRGKIK
jgi:23S rRNA pseudouridine1911/1915/1917 synthase